MPNNILESLLVSIGCSLKDEKPVKEIATKALSRIANTLKTDPNQLTSWSKETIISYSIYEWAYVSYGKNDEERNDLLDNKALLNSISTLVSEKFLLINLRPQAFQSHVSSFSPVSSTAEAILSKMDLINSKVCKHDPTKTLIPDLFDRIIKEAIGIVKMLNLGLANDAYGSWRTLHEAECIIKLLIEGGDDLQRVYLKHIVYNNAFREAIEDKDATDQIFIQMKAEMKDKGLKSKDMKKYIEYGWLYSSNSFDSTKPAFKLNFRDGVQKAAKLSKYSVWYEAASELSHSSPVFFYSREEYFIELATIGLYDVLERIEDMFYKYMERYGVITQIDQISRSILHDQMVIIAHDRRILFQDKYKDAELYDEEEI